MKDINNTEKKKVGIVFEDLTQKNDPDAVLNYYRMLAIGWFNIGLYFFNLFNYKANFAFLQSIVGHDLAGLIVYVIGMFFGLWLFLWRGFAFITCAPMGQLHESINKKYAFMKGGKPVKKGEYKNIDNVIEFAEASCKFATREETAQIMSNFNTLSMLGNTPEGRDSLDYINCSLATMSRESGLKFIGSFSK